MCMDFVVIDDQTLGQTVFSSAHRSSIISFLTLPPLDSVQNVGLHVRTHGDAPTYLVHGPRLLDGILSHGHDQSLYFPFRVAEVHCDTIAA
jgi:hypothetical protein